MQDLYSHTMLRWERITGDLMLPKEIAISYIIASMLAKPAQHLLIRPFI